MTTYVPVYDDTELDPHLPATRAVAQLHLRLGLPATFCLHTAPLEADPQLVEAYRRLLAEGDGLFEFLPHSHTHDCLLPHGTLGTSPAEVKLVEEVGRCRQLIQHWFNLEAAGWRCPNGYFGGMRGRPQVLQLLRDHGYRFLSSFLMGPGDTVPAPLTQPFFYTEDGFPDLLEVPANDWHDNVLNGWPPLAAAWPPCVPSGLPAHPPTTAEEKFAVYRPNLEYSLEQGLELYSPGLHPFSIYRFDPEPRWVELLLRHVMELKVPVKTMSRFVDDRK